MSTPTDADRVTLHIAGHVHGDWLKYSIDSDFFTPADGWSVSLGTPATALPEYLQPWAEVQIRVGDELVMSGRVDRVRHAFRKGEHVLDIRGRDGAAVLLDCSAPIFVSREITLPEAVATVARPLGIAELDIAGRDAAFVKVTVEPGMSAWEVIQQAAEASGLWPWFTPDGTLKIAAPDYTTPPVAALIMRLDGKGNNVIDIEIDKGCERRYSEVTVLAQGAGTEKKKSKNAMKGKATDPNVKWHRPLIVSEGYYRSRKCRN